ncbi:transcriptional regulator [Actinophytocola xinjiangensis]|uniref:Transcriptional regulator n=1 Tax=Actinophytocola xinjiangensis TaxID=485602 RepID=A0A7Z0WRA8_9PSEU|nr:helix-turn-helix transcriptional regulator [Actinophytocola xinjiangensis]OLF12319.1 transcriptional regulator [Actinophytocola xinjiangensis]
MVETFGDLLRRCRSAAGISMSALAVRVNYSKSYLSKLENDLKPPNATVARLCDAALDAGGALIESARECSGERSGKLDRRQVLTAGAVLGMAFTGGPRPVPDERVVTGLRTTFEHLRQLATHTSPAVVIEPLVAQVRTVHALARENPEPVRTRLLLLAARIAEHTGWMYQEAGDDEQALRWTRDAADLARAGGDREIAGYSLVREAGLAFYRHDAAATIGLARQAQRMPLSGARTLGLALRREAQGHALAGDRDACARAFDRAAELVADAPAADSAYPVLGSTAPDPIGLARGWSLFDLGRSAEAAEVLDRALVAVPATSRRTRARFGARAALAHALAGDLDQCCASLPGTLDDAAHVDSATVRLDLRDLARTLNRWRGHPGVRDLYPDLNRVLQRHWQYS